VKLGLSHFLLFIESMKGKRWHRWFVRELLVFVLSCFIVSHLIQGRNHRSSQVNLSVDNDIEARLRLPLDFISPNAPKNVGTTTSEMNGKSCASWISAQRRKILFVELHTWEMYYGPSKYKTGEYYVSSTWDYALRRNEFEVHRVSTRHFFERMRPSEMRSYHRIFLRDPKWHPYFRHHDILCRIRPMYYFGEWYQNKVNITWFQWPFDRKVSEAFFARPSDNFIFNSFIQLLIHQQILVAHPEAFNTFMGYFPHNLIVDKTIPKAERGRVGLLYGKKPEYFVPHQALIQRLVNEGFELHSTCTDTSETMKCPFPKEVIQHQNIGPTEYASLLNNFSFMLGFQKVSVKRLCCSLFHSKQLSQPCLWHLGF
jgi:hypothetical protein